MQNIEIKILLENLLARVVSDGGGSRHLPGVLTEREFQALRAAVTMLESVPDARIPPDGPPNRARGEIPVSASEPVAATPSEQVESPELDMSVLTLPPVQGMRLCLDFGTAMSKATLVQDGDQERILVLELGKPGDEEEISAVMLLSSVYIDNDRRIWFGKHAVDRSLVEGGDGSRQRLDNIKRRLSEDGFDEPVQTPLFAPGGVEVTYGQMILAYLMFFTWATNRALEEEGLPRNVQRRFAMPCFPSDKSRDVSHSLKKMLGDAQVLADTFQDELMSGLPVLKFVTAVNALHQRKRDYSFVAEDITEPLGVAGALLSWQTRVDMLAMVIDVGAGTSDMSMYRILFDPTLGKNTAEEVRHSSRGITEAGNYLDRALVEFVLKKAGLTSADPRSIATRSRLELNVRDYKETLFNDGFVFVALPGGGEVNVELSEFRDLDAIVGFGKSLHDTMTQILESVDPSFVDWISASPQRYLTVVLTGGGASLPMVKELAKGTIAVRGRQVRVEAAIAFPAWLQTEYPELEQDFPRVAVSLGGARKRLIQRGAGASITGGDVPHPPILGGYYQKGG